MYVCVWREPWAPRMEGATLHFVSLLFWVFSPEQDPLLQKLHALWAWRDMEKVSLIKRRTRSGQICCSAWGNPPSPLSEEEAVWPLPLAQAPWGPAGGCLVNSTGVPLPPRGDSAGHLGLAPFLPRWEVGPLESRVSHVGSVARGLAKQGQQRAFWVSLAPGRNASGLCQPARPVDLAPGRAGLLCRLERAGLADPHCP